MLSTQTIFHMRRPFRQQQQHMLLLLLFLLVIVVVVIVPAFSLFPKNEVSAFLATTGCTGAAISTRGSCCGRMTVTTSTTTTAKTTTTAIDIDIAGAQAAAATIHIPGESCSGEKITVVGATGYIGKAVVKESIRRGYPTTAVLRPGSNVDATAYINNNHNNNNNSNDNNKSNNNITIKRFDISDRNACLVTKDDDDNEDDTTSICLFPKGSVDVVVCCLASRSGTKNEAYAIDYQASLNVAQAAKQAGARRFILLSAYCVKSAEQNEDHALQFQYAKKKLELELLDMSSSSSSTSSNDNDNDETTFDYVAVRPTAFFKSVSGQLEAVQGGSPYIIFDLGNGKTSSCNPISEPDLASALIDQVVDNTHKNTYWNVGGPDAGSDKIQQGKMIYDVLGIKNKNIDTTNNEQEQDDELPCIKVPIGILHGIVNTFQWFADLFKSDKLNDAAEIARIVRYYAIEDVSYYIFPIFFFLFFLSEVNIVLLLDTIYENACIHTHFI